MNSKSEDFNYWIVLAAIGAAITLAVIASVSQLL